MKKKTFDELTPQEVEGLTDAQYDDLMQNGSVEVSEKPASEKQQEKDASTQEDEKKPDQQEETKSQQGQETPPKTLEQRLAEAEMQLQEMTRANKGLRYEIERLRQERRDLKASSNTQQSELVKKILSMPDGEFIETTPIKEAILAEQKKEEEAERRRLERIDQIERAKGLAMLKYEDYEQVIKEGLPAFIDSLSEEYRRLVIEDITNAVNPPETAYIYGKRGMEKLNKSAIQNKPEIKQQTTQQPVILRSTKGGRVSPEEKTLQELVFGNQSAEDLERLAIEKERELERG